MKNVKQARAKNSQNPPRKQSQKAEEKPALLPPNLSRAIDSAAQAQGISREIFIHNALYLAVWDRATGVMLEKESRNGDPVGLLLNTNLTQQEQELILNLCKKGLLRLTVGRGSKGLCKMEDHLQSITALVHLMESQLEEFLNDTNSVLNAKHAAGLVHLNSRTLEDLWATFHEAWQDQCFSERSCKAGAKAAAGVSGKNI